MILIPLVAIAKETQGNLNYILWDMLVSRINILKPTHHCMQYKQRILEHFGLEGAFKGRL